MQNIEQALAQELAGRVSKEIDLAALAKKLAPQIERRITKAVLDFASSPDCVDWFLDDPKATKAFSELVVRALTKLK